MARFKILIFRIAGIKNVAVTSLKSETCAQMCKKQEGDSSGCREAWKNRLTSHLLTFLISL